MSTLRFHHLSEPFQPAGGKSRPRAQAEESRRKRGCRGLPAPCCAAAHPRGTCALLSGSVRWRWSAQPWAGGIRTRPTGPAKGSQREWRPVTGVWAAGCDALTSAPCRAALEEQEVGPGLSAVLRAEAERGAAHSPRALFAQPGREPASSRLAPCPPVPSCWSCHLFG